MFIELRKFVNNPLNPSKLNNHYPYVRIRSKLNVRIKNVRTIQKFSHERNKNL